MRTFCTIITSNYFPYAVTLYESLKKINPDELLQVLICDEGPVPATRDVSAKISMFRLTDIYHQFKADEIIQKYRKGHMDQLRWSLKPVFISYLLEKGFEKVIFSDCDIFFFTDYSFLFSELDTHSIILTPGRTTRYPRVHEDEFLSGFKYGLFNAGFIGAAKNGIPPLHWWTECCLYNIETNFEKGLFVDQKYLDALPVLFETIGIIRHPGCNVAFWNQHECKRSMKKGEVWINDQFPLIFVHFTNKYIGELLNGNDPLMYPYYKKYESCFHESGHQFGEFISDLPEYTEAGPLVTLKRKLLLRTRLKNWLFRLSRSI